MNELQGSDMNTTDRSKSMMEVPDQLRKLRRKFLRYQQAEIVYSLSHKKIAELAGEAGAVYRMDGTVLIDREIFEAYLRERQRLPLTALRAPEAEKQEAIDGLYS